MSFWRNYTVVTKTFGDGWYKCHLMSDDYRWGFKLPDTFKGNNPDFVVSIHDCHEGNIEDEWGMNLMLGKIIHDISILSLDRKIL